MFIHDRFRTCKEACEAYLGSSHARELSWWLYGNQPTVTHAARIILPLLLLGFVVGSFIWLLLVMFVRGFRDQLLYWLVALVVTYWLYAGLS